MVAGQPAYEIRIGNLSFSFRSAVDWTPPVRTTPDPEALAAGLRALDVILPGQIPQDGLAALAGPEIRRERLPVVARTAEDATRYLGDLVRLAATAKTTPKLRPLVPLLGLGPGLTPSGDDAIGGALVALRCLGLDDLADATRTWLEISAPGRTNDISLAHLMAAAEGYGSAALHEILHDLLCGRAARLGAALAEIDSIGHTSGWDALAGAVIVLRAWLDTHRHAGRGASHVPAPDDRSIL